MHTAITDVGGKCLDAASIETSTAPAGRHGTIRRQELRVDRGVVAIGTDYSYSRISRHRFRRVQRGCEHAHRHLNACVSERSTHRYDTMGKCGCANGEFEVKLNIRGELFRVCVGNR